MNQTGKIITAAGTILAMIGCSLATEGGRWIVAPILFLAGVAAIFLGVHLVHKSEDIKIRRRIDRHSDDADKLRETKAVRAAYHEFKLKGLIK